MDCPRCHEPLLAEHEGLFGDILVRRCAECSALWMPPESLDRLDDNVSVQASQIEWAEADRQTGFGCPTCVGGYREASPHLAEVSLGATPPITAFRCTQCRGFLLDPGTLDRIRAFVVGRHR
ncbi:MAG: hypothetical protein AAF721_17355 [Myxococcota bacterium]